MKKLLRKKGKGEGEEMSFVDGVVRKRGAGRARYGAGRGGVER